MTIGTKLPRGFTIRPISRKTMRTVRVTSRYVIFGLNSLGKGKQFQDQLQTQPMTTCPAIGMVVSRRKIRGRSHLRSFRKQNPSKLNSPKICNRIRPTLLHSPREINKFRKLHLIRTGQLKLQEYFGPHVLAYLLIFLPCILIERHFPRVSHPHFGESILMK